MSSRNLAYVPSKHGGGSGSDKSSGGGAACVEIVGFPQILYIRTCGDPDILFVPLLDASREAGKMVERLATQGENRQNAAMLSGMHLASTLLKDSSFSLGAKGLSHETAYTMDLDADTMHMTAQVYSTVSRRTSFFKIEIAGKISGGPFVVRNPLRGTVIMQVEEEKLRQANFFSGSLAQECLRAQMEEERFGRLDEVLGTEANSDVRFMVTHAGNKIPVTLRQKDQTSAWDIIVGRRQEWTGTLTPEMEAHLKSVLGFIHELFERK
jgi:hypothetical protein